MVISIALNYKNWLSLEEKPRFQLFYKKEGHTFPLCSHFSWA
jgi:hypothetical protein